MSEISSVLQTLQWQFLLSVIANEVKRSVSIILKQLQWLFQKWSTRFL